MLQNLFLLLHSAGTKRGQDEELQHIEDTGEPELKKANQANEAVLNQATAEHGNPDNTVESVESKEDQKEELKEEATKTSEIRCPKHRCGYVIGRKGSKILDTSVNVVELTYSAEF